MCRFFFSCNSRSTVPCFFFWHYYKSCCQNTLHLENCKFTQYTGNYGNKIGANSCYKGGITKKNNSSRMTGAETDILLLTEGTSTTHGVTIKEKLYKNFLVAHVSVNRSYRILP